MKSPSRGQWLVISSLHIGTFDKSPGVLSIQFSDLLPHSFLEGLTIRAHKHFKIGGQIWVVFLSCSLIRDGIMTIKHVCVIICSEEGMILLVLVGTMDKGSETGKYLMGCLIPSCLGAIIAKMLWRVMNMCGHVKGMRCQWFNRLQRERRLILD